MQEGAGVCAMQEWMQGGARGERCNAGQEPLCYPRCSGTIRWHDEATHRVTGERAATPHAVEASVDVRALRAPTGPLA